MAKKKLTRKELIKGPDEFITTTGKAIQWSRENTKPLIYGTVAFFALIVLIAGYRFVSEKREQAAAALLSRCLETYQKAQSSDENPVQALAVVKPDFDRLVKEYGGQPAGRLGRVIYANLALSAQDADTAMALYEKALGELGDDPSLHNTILNGLAMAAEQKGDQAAAISYLEKITTGNSTLLKDVALFNLGRLYTLTGKTEKGQAAYRQLSQDFPNSLYADIAREKAAG